MGLALGTRRVGDPSACPTGSTHRGGAPLAQLSTRCANVAVPLTKDIIDRVEAARVAVGVQRALIALGYDAGPLGGIDEPRASAAIRQVQHEMGWPVTGQPSDGLRKILILRLKLMVS